MRLKGLSPAIRPTAEQLSLDRPVSHGTLQSTEFFMCGCARRSGMPKFTRGVVRVLGVLALAALFQPMITDMASADDAGRKFSRCIIGCNETRRNCDDGCATQCRDLFPNDKPARDACIASCKAGCLEQSDDCKLVCQQIKEPPCPTDP